MKRDDWVFVGMRLLGLYFMAVALAGLPTVLVFASEPEYGGKLMSSTVMQLGVQLLIGFVLCMGAPGILSWLKHKDSAQMGSVDKNE